MKLNVEKILSELKRIDKSQSWLARQANKSQQLVNYWLKTGSLRGAEPIGRALNIEPRDLIK